MKQDNYKALEEFFLRLIPKAKGGYYFADARNLLHALFSPEEKALFKKYMNGKGTGIYLELTVIWKHDLEAFLHRSVRRFLDKNKLPSWFSLTKITELQMVDGCGYYECDFLSILTDKQKKSYDTIMFGRQQLLQDNKEVTYLSDCREVLRALINLEIV